MRKSKLLLVALSISLPLPTPLALAQTTMPSAKLAVGLPAMRSVEYTMNRPEPTAGPFRAAGYISFIQGLTTEDLFRLSVMPTDSAGGAIPAVGSAITGGTSRAAQPLVFASETNARFTHTERGCLVDTIPNSPSVWTGNDPVLKEPTLISTHNRARHCVFYDPAPATRDWRYPKTFATGKLIAVMNLVEETDFVDLMNHIGSGTAVVELECASDVSWNRPDGTTRSFNMASLGRQMIAEFQFQIVPKPPALDPDFAPFTLIFADSGVWKPTQFGPVPSCSTSTEACVTPIAPCP